MDNIIINISRKAREKKKISFDEMSSIIIEMCNIRNITLSEFSKFLNRDESWIRKKYLTPLIKSKKIQMLYPQTPNQHIVKNNL